MASTQQLKRRITSVKNTRQITKAMELVAASKMRRAQEAAARSREFRNLARAILTRLRQLTDVTAHPLYRQRALKVRLYVVVTGDRGLAGAYNSNVFRHLTRELLADQEKGIESHLIVIGKQGTRMVSRLQNVAMIGAYHDFSQRPTADEIQPILNTVIEQFKTEIVDAVDVIYTDYKSSIRQEVTTLRLLPAAFQEVEITPDLEKAVFEPSPLEVLESVTERLVEVQLMQALLEANASEESMRMMAMKSASDNANDLIDDLTLTFNTARQAAITQELAEITGGAEAIK